MPLVISLGRLPFVRYFPYPSISVAEFCHKSTISSLMLISRETPKDWIEVMPILYIDCLDCKMTTLNAPLQSKAYNVSKRIYNYLILEVWWHEVKTGWLGEQGRWSEFCVLISYRVCYSIACSQAYSAVAAWGGVLLGILGGAIPTGSPNPDLILDQKHVTFHASFQTGRWSQNATLRVYIKQKLCHYCQD